jgi:uncharacterized protein (DUF1919 family)
VYKYFDLPFTSPFIGLFLRAEDYIQVLEQFDHLDLSDIRFDHSSKDYPEPRWYPVGHLQGNLEVHFLHYKTLEEAESKWKRRVKRLREIPADRIFFRFCDREDAKPEHFERFDQLSNPRKIAFAVNALPYPYVFETAPDPKHADRVDDGVKLFERELDKGFDLPHFLNTGVPVYRHKS